LNLRALINSGENKRVEFKEQLPKNESIVKTVIAFSNTSGGKLIVGIVKFELREKGLFVEAVFYRPISETVAKPLLNRC